MTAVATCTFGPLTLEYDERVLVPRPWTLLQSEWAAELAAVSPAGPLLELCAGAGHIGLAAAVLADRDLVQVELDPVAADYARRNASATDLASRVAVRQGPMDAVLTPGEQFPIVVADPPYLPTDQVGRWPDDPLLAIDGGPDGLAVVRLCLQVAAAHTAAGGLLLLQIAGDPQVAAVRSLVEDGPWSLADVRSHDPERAVVLLTRS